MSDHVVENDLSGPTDAAPQRPAAAVTEVAISAPVLQRAVGNAALRRLIEAHPQRVRAALSGRRLQRQPGTQQGGGAGSVLKNLKRARSGGLTWPDYAGTKPASDPNLALTATNIETSFGGRKATKTSTVRADMDPAAGGYQLRDNVTVEIVFDGKASWKDPALPASIDKLIFDHELGHYNITALYGRDLFIEIMQLKAKVYPGVADGQNEVTSLVSRYRGLLAHAQAEYESQTQNGSPVTSTIGPPRKNTDQVKWEGAIEKAFTVERTPQVTAPDGATYKLPLEDVLRQAGML